MSIERTSIEIYTNNTPTLTFTIRTKSTTPGTQGTVYDLTGATVTFYVKQNTTDTTYISSTACTVATPTSGQCTVTLAKIATAGNYIGELKYVKNSTELTLKTFTLIVNQALG